MPGSRRPERFVFRAVRAPGNLVEVVGVFVLAVSMAIALGARPALVNAGATVFAVARLIHTAAYYANRLRLRFLSFVVGSVSVVVLLVASALTL